MKLEGYSQVLVRLKLGFKYIDSIQGLKVLVDLQLKKRKEKEEAAVVDNLEIISHYRKMW